MRGGILGIALALTVVAPSAAQLPTPTVSSFAVEASPSAAAQTNEIQDLRATLRTLQQRLDRLSALQPDSNSLASTGSTAQKESTESEPLSFRLEWDQGFSVRSTDDRFKIHLGGNVQFDTGWNAASQTVQYGSGGIGDLQDGSVFRRARIRTDGTLFGHIEWMTEFDFANSVENDTGSSSQTIGTPSFTNVWLGVNDIPYIGTLRAGWMTEPLGLENSTSSRWLPFMERMPGNPQFLSPGLMLLNQSTNERATWCIGVFHAQNDNFGFGYGDGEYATTGRVTWLPLYDDDGAELLHLGLGGAHRSLDLGQIKLRGRPSVRTMPSTVEPTLAETSTISGTTEDILDAELAWVSGPWTFQSEYFSLWIHDAVTNQPLGTLSYQGAYAEVLYFLTGEHQPYNRRDGTMGRVIPLSNFNIWEGPHGWGAWQVGLRYAYLDLQNKGVNGATLNDITLGLNWFLNSQAKVQWNLAVDHRESTPTGSNGWTTIFGIRLALDY